jgi:DNA modification methylase
MSAAAPEFTVEYLDPRDLEPSPLNFRRHPAPQRQALKASLEEHGYLSAPIWNRASGHILDGHARVDLALEAGETKIPVRVIDVPEEQEKRILRAFDRIGSMAVEDEEALDRLIAEIDDPALERLLSELEEEPKGGLAEGADPDAVPENVETRVQPGDLWQMGVHRLLCGDSTSAEDVRRLMGDKRAVMMATDPPYLVDYQGGNHPESWSNKPEVRDKHWDDYNEATGPEFFAAFLRVALEEALTASPAIYQWHAHKRQALVEKAWEDAGLLVHQQIIWVKSRAVLTRSHYMWAHEPCFYGWVQGKMPERRPPNNGTTVWEIGSESNDIHPTQKPVEIFSRPVEYHAAPSDICYEPFCGSGSQIIAAEMNGRACYAMELAPEFCDVILARWEAATGRHAELLARSA